MQLVLGTSHEHKTAPRGIQGNDRESPFLCFFYINHSFFEDSLDGIMPSENGVTVNNSDIFLDSILVDNMTWTATKNELDEICEWF